MSGASEVNYGEKFDEFYILVKAVRSSKMNLTVDISPHEIKSIDSDIIDLSIELVSYISDEERDIVFAPVHTDRLDSSEILIRSEESGGYAKIGKKIRPRSTVERWAFSVTIDN